MVYIRLFILQNQRVSLRLYKFNLNTSLISLFQKQISTWVHDYQENWVRASINYAQLIETSISRSGISVVNFININEIHPAIGIKTVSCLI